MSAINDGGPAFPSQHDHILYHSDDPTKPAQTIRGMWDGGMTLRDYFAAKALQGCLAAIKTGPTSQSDLPSLFEGAAVTAYGFADAMLKAREQAR